MKINAQSFLHICGLCKAKTFSTIMNFKGLIFVLCFISVQACFNDLLKKKFNETDLDQDGFLTQTELCKNPDENCAKLWEGFDANEDGKASCQEVSFAYATIFLNPDKAKQIRKVMANKPENCKKINVKEMHKILVDPQEKLDYSKLRMAMSTLDLDQDGQVSCFELIVELTAPGRGEERDTETGFERY